MSVNDIRIDFSNYIRNSYWESTNDVDGLRKLVQLAKDSSYLTSSELKLIDSLNSYHIQYESQYVNQSIDEKFFDNSKHDKRTYHIWDFIIYTKERNILIDIDGSIHKLEYGKRVVADIDVAEYINFNDSKRIYQTDGLDAYIILVYDDEINRNTPVLKLKTGETIEYHQFLNIIQIMDMDIRGLKKLMKDGDL